MKIVRYFLIIAFAVAAFFACKEEQRFGLSSSDTTIPGKPILKAVKPLYGGARIFFSAPDDKDILQIMAEYDAICGETFRFNASYFKDSLDVLGLGEEKEYTIRMYSIDRSGNKSDIVPVKVTPLESSILRVAKTIKAKAGFGSFYLDWVNELKQPVNIVVDFEFTMDGRKRNLVEVLSSNLPTDRKFIRDLDLGPDQPINMKITVEDIYCNVTEPIEVKGMVLLQDELIPKADWKLPIPGDSIAGIPMVFGNYADGRLYRIKDDIVDWRYNNNYINCQDNGRVGKGGKLNAGDTTNLWNLFIDLGAYYKLSRIVTHQRHSGGESGQDKGQFYDDENVGRYKMWWLDEDVDDDVKGNMIGTELVRGRWRPISEHRIPIPPAASEVEWIKNARKGDEAYMYPNDPDFTPSTRWFRYEGIAGFRDNYTNQKHNCLSEITLYGKFDKPKN